MATPEKERTTVRLQRCLDRVHGGDFKAQDEMIELAWRRLLHLTEIMVRPYPDLTRIEGKEDIFQKAMLRFWESLKNITPRSLRDFFSLAALQIRRTLVDLVRHYYGPLGAGANEVNQGQGDSQQENAEPIDSDSPLDLIAWTEFHEQIEELPAELREVFELMWYYELPPGEIAEILDVSSKTVRSRWREARFELYNRLKGQLPSL